MVLDIVNTVLLHCHRARCLPRVLSLFLVLSRVLGQCSTRRTTCTSLSHPLHGQRIHRCHTRSTDNVYTAVTPAPRTTYTPLSHLLHGQRVHRCHTRSTDNVYTAATPAPRTTCTPLPHPLHGQRVHRCHTCSTSLSTLLPWLHSLSIYTRAQQWLKMPSPDSGVKMKV